MFLQRSPTVPNASPRRLPGRTVGMMLNHHIFPYGNCRQNRSTESLPELPIPKLTGSLWVNSQKYADLVMCLVEFLHDK